MRAHHQVIALDDQVVDRDSRQVELERLPGLAVIGREGHPALGADVESALLLRVVPDDVQRNILGQRSGYQGPGLAVIASPVQVGVHIVDHMRVNDDERRPGIERRRLDHLDRGPLGQAGQVLGDVGPALAGIARDVHQAIVRAHPDQPFFLG